MEVIEGLKKCAQMWDLLADPTFVKKLRPGHETAKVEALKHMNISDKDYPESECFCCETFRDCILCNSVMEWIPYAGITACTEDTSTFHIWCHSKLGSPTNLAAAKSIADKAHAAVTKLESGLSTPTNFEGRKAVWETMAGELHDETGAYLGDVATCYNCGACVTVLPDERKGRFGYDIVKLSEVIPCCTSPHYMWG